MLKMEEVVESLEQSQVVLEVGTKTTHQMRLGHMLYQLQGLKRSLMAVGRKFIITLDHQRLTICYLVQLEAMEVEVMT